MCLRLQTAVSSASAVLAMDVSGSATIGAEGLVDLMPVTSVLWVRDWRVGDGVVLAQSVFRMARSLGGFYTFGCRCHVRSTLGQGLDHRCRAPHFRASQSVTPVPGLDGQAGVATANQSLRRILIYGAWEEGGETTYVQQPGPST